MKCAKYFDSRFLGAMALVIAFSVPAFAENAPAEGAAGQEITYSKHISRLVQENCQTCHHPNGVGPFSMTNYRQTKAWGKMIKEVVSEGRMPPWHADPSVGHFQNDRSLSADEKAMFVKWVDSGMPRGDDADLPAPIEIHNEWRIGEPDMVFEMPQEMSIDPTGVVPYQYFVTETNFTEDKWVSMAQCKPGNPKVVHHIIVFIRDPKNAQGEMRGESGQGFFDAFAPGSIPMMLEPGVARKIPAGAQIVWQMHYTPTGKAEVDRSQFGIKFAEGPIHTEIMTDQAINFEFQIPANNNAFKVEADKVFDQDVILHDLSPHMHYRGKSFDYTLTFPDGRVQKLLNVPGYDFNWQTTYILDEPISIPKGTKMHCVAYFDNSDANPFNPDPSKDVTWGDQTWEEMMIGFFNYSVPTGAANQAKAESNVNGD